MVIQKMNYSLFRSIVGSNKTSISIATPTNSFYIPSKRVDPFIEPDFEKIDFPSEKPSIILVQAVGASGKTTTANALSHDLHLPILDLAKHKPVADHTLTGILTSTYSTDNIGFVLRAVEDGSYGIIIDGIDEGRSKTTEAAFQAFLDDLINRSKGCKWVSLVILGRSQVLDDTWCYLGDHDADVGLIQIRPFTLNRAKEYINTKVSISSSSQQNIFELVRDNILGRLSDAFATTSTASSNDTFLSFIGYPPVLDAISTLLRRERNYYKLTDQMDLRDNVQIDLLVQICNYLVAREQMDKARPNFVDELADYATTDVTLDVIQSLYDESEQCARVLATALDREFPVQLIDDKILNPSSTK